jgi:hypothetical protein
VQALERGDGAVATAPPTQRWLLVEQPGPWGRDALTGSRFDQAVAPRLAARSRAEGVRLLLVRRPGDRLADSGRRWAYADGRPGREGLWWSTRSADADLLDVPWDGSVGEPATGPVFLVCTHGGHDPCCALRGRPLARALPVAGPAAAWECSHVGGCRFAANVVVLPHGFFYGQVPGDGAELVAAHERGHVAPEWLRGRAGLSAPVAAAQAAARRQLGLTGVDDLAPLATGPVVVDPGGAERFAVRLALPDGEVRVTVQRTPSASSGRLTCAAVHEAHPWEWTVLDLETVRDS